MTCRKEKGKAVLCLGLSLALVACALFSHLPLITASGAERTFDIGVNPESVTAVLEDSGVLVVRGSGQIRDYTPETAPFAGLDIKELRLGADIASIGDYAFYGCGSFTKPIFLPTKLSRIGEGAFSGKSAETAPHPTFVENPFMETMVTRKREEASSSENFSSENSSGDSSSGENSSGENSSSESSSGESSSGGVSSKAGGEPVSSSPEGENRFVVETVTRQELGGNIFFPRQDQPLFTCSENNEPFRAAMTAAGYREAQSVVSATFSGGEGEGEAVRRLPISGGVIVLPECPEELSPPQGGDLFAYSFEGWTEAQDEAGSLRPAGSQYTVGEQDELYFIANWAKRVTAKLLVSRTEDGFRFTVPELSQYDVTGYRWQSSVENGPWKDLGEEAEQSCVRKPGENEKLRCIVTGKPKQNLFAALFSAAGEEELVFPAAESLDSTASAVLEAAGSQPGEVKTASAAISLPASGAQNTYKITEVKLTGSFSLVMPKTEDPLSLPEFTGSQTAGNTFALQIKPGSGWTEASASSKAYLLSALPEGGETWDSGVPGLWEQGSLVTGDASRAELQIALVYHSGFQSFSGGKARLVLEEYTAENVLQNRVTVELTLEEQGSVTQSAFTLAGRNFAAETGGAAAIFGNGGLTARFTTEYTPASGDAERKLRLYKTGESGASPASFPSGTKIVLMDQTAARSFYSCTASGQQELALSTFSYPGPEVGKRVCEKLLFALSFSGSPLQTGNYYLTLSGDQEEAAPARAEFSVVGEQSASLALEQGESTVGTVWQMTVAPQLPENDIRYEAGVSVSLKLWKNGTVVSFPEGTVISGGELPSCCGGAASLFLPKSGGQITLDLSMVSEAALAAGEYQVTASLSPRPGLQAGAVLQETAASGKVNFTLERVGTEAPQRALGVSLSGGQRLLEPGGGITLSASYEEAQEGDRLEAEILKKTGEGPGESSYTVLAAASDWGAASPEQVSGTGSCELSLTVPSEQEKGTYRVLVKLVDAQGNILLKEPYNFIVKEVSTP